ncbi:acyl-CoA dehydrogenase family protein [Paraconexibacter antarcticus]|uniref:Acyl-CoA dehydrogenase family protein n=1 Tax=Paraconexibacter antarcticus TaxID=2949664 RepID=A0ABY5DR94_9ACTN|nr:acyl-CoA dehydrogenase family protein [Paraconexibacter antarcticus]UTI63607.1 acyl-CoA dehydrogenase family protein [Paraconexibacter antarcticus]
MDFRDSAEDAQYREQVRAWLTQAVAELGPEPATISERLPYWQPWQKRLHEAGYAGLAWPKAYGGQDASLMQQVIFAQEYDRAGAPDRLNVLGEGLAGPTIIDFGTEAQKERFLPAILKGEEVWCQLFSEPAAGSDLAALEARAERDDESGGWRITGQKVWTSRAQVSSYGILLARTGGGPRHAGITYFLLPMDQEGVTVRPLRHILGEAEFNEVFLDDVFIPDELVVGPVDGGWKIAMATLGYERVVLATGRVNMQRLLDDLIAEVRESGTGADPQVRRTIADLYARTSVYRLNGLRAVSDMAAGTPGPTSSLGKLMSAPLLEDMADFAVSRHGLAGQLEPDDDDPAHPSPCPRWLRLSYQARGTSIAGGTTFIQRNIVAERVLGLPRK